MKQVTVYYREEEYSMKLICFEYINDPKKVWGLSPMNDKLNLDLYIFQNVCILFLSRKFYQGYQDIICKRRS